MTRRRIRVAYWTPAGRKTVSADITLFNGSQGHGFAAERANHLKDIISGKTAELVGVNNARNGPDRLVNGVPIQTKYHRSGANCVADCFQDGSYRYLCSDGSPMPLEVPYDKYESALPAMERRIARGEVPGVSDPRDAKLLVRRGFVTYEQAINLTKLGTIESLTYDVVSGARVGRAAFGVAAVVSYALAVWRGENEGESLADACVTGLENGAVAWAGSVLASQLGRTWLRRSLGCNALTGAATVVVLSSMHFARLFRREVSVGQVLKDLTAAAASVAGSAVGWQAGVRLAAGLGPVGALVGGVVGALAMGTLCGTTALRVMDTYIKDDAEEMMAVAETVFRRLALDYQLTEYQATRVARHFASGNLSATLREMYASTDRPAFAERRLTPLVEREVQGSGVVTAE